MRIAIAAVTFFLAWHSEGAWTVAERSNPDGPGKVIEVLEARPIARFVYGDGQAKPYLHVLGEAGELLTNGGLDRDGKPAGAFPHHRGLFIGWKIISELGTDDLWHMTHGCKMEVAKLEKLEGGADAATIVAEVLWRSAKATNGSDLLLREKRTLTISRPAAKRTQIDTSFVLLPERDLRLAGDLQHSGVHFRASNEVHARAAETTYLTEPENVAKGAGLKWCRLFFPIGTNWYSALQLNAPTNPVEELSTRNYGRFGYFFKKALSKGEPLSLRYRFIIEQTPPPAEPPKLSDDQREQARKQAQEFYRQFVSRTGT